MKKNFLNIIVLITVFAISAKTEVTVSGIETIYQPVQLTVPTREEFPLTPASFAGQTYSDSDVEFKFKAKADKDSEVYIEVCYCRAETKLRSTAQSDATNVQANPLADTSGPCSSCQYKEMPVVRLSKDKAFVKFTDNIKITPQDVKERNAQRALRSSDCVVWRSDKVAVPAGAPAQEGEEGKEKWTDISIPWDTYTFDGKSLSKKDIDVDILDGAGEVLGSANIYNYNYFAPRMVEFDYENNKFSTLIPYDVEDAAIFYVPEDPETVQYYLDGYTEEIIYLIAYRDLNQAIPTKKKSIGPLTNLSSQTPDAKAAHMSDESIKYTPKDNNFTQYSLNRGGLEAGAYSMFIVWRSKRPKASDSFYADAFAFLIPFILTEEEVLPESANVPVDLYAYPPPGYTPVKPAAPAKVANRVTSKQDGIYVNNCEGGSCSAFDPGGKLLFKGTIDTDRYCVPVTQNGIYVIRTTDSEGNEQTDMAIKQ